MRRGLLGNEPKRLTDLVELASYVFAADRTTKRGTLIDKNMGADWRRHFRLVVAVRELAFWHRPEVATALYDSLCFMSETRGPSSLYPICNHFRCNSSWV